MAPIPRHPGADVFSYTHSRIRKKDTKPEVTLRKALWAAGLRFRKHYKELPGQPDVAFTRAKVAVFCDGIFWHGRDWEARKPRLVKNREYWIPKIERNMARDRRNNAALEGAGWLVIRFWEDEITKELSRCVEEVRAAVASRRPPRAVGPGGGAAQDAERRESTSRT